MIMKEYHKQITATSIFGRLFSFLSPPPLPPHHQMVDNGQPTAADADENEVKQRIFRYFDEDGDGKISAGELQRCLKNVGGEMMSDEEAELAVRTSDVDGDGVVGFEDFAKLMEESVAGGGSEEEELLLREAFSMYSSSVSGGYITPKSLKQMLTKLRQPTSISNCKTIISQFDLNGDGVLDFDEFKIMMTH